MATTHEELERDRRQALALLLEFAREVSRRELLRRSGACERELEEQQIEIERARRRLARFSREHAFAEGADG